MNPRGYMAFYDRLGNIKQGISDTNEILGRFSSTLSSIIAVVVSLIIANVALGLQLPISTNSSGTILHSTFLVWGFVFLINSLGIMLISLLMTVKSIEAKLGEIFSFLDIVLRIMLILSVLIATLVKPGLLLDIAGSVGILLVFLLYFYYGEWFFFPGDALLYHQRIRLHMSELSNSLPLSFCGDDSFTINP